MRRIKTDVSAKENPQGRHYTPKSASTATQVLDPTTSHPPKSLKTSSQLRKLG
jgi:hypothetical protein